MKKKTYIQPSVQVVDFKSTHILAASNIMRVNDEGVQPSDDPDAEEIGWGLQW